MTDRASALPVVVHLFGVMDRGGAELRTIETANWLGPSACRMVYVTLSGRGGELAGQIHRDGGVVMPLKLGPAFVWRFPRLLRRLGADTVDSHVATFSGAILFLARMAGVRRRIAHFHSDGDQQKATVRRRAQRAVMRQLIDRSATAILGVSPGSLEYGWRRGWEYDRRCRVVVEGIDTSSLPAPEQRAAARTTLDVHDGEIVICHVGKPDTNKNRMRAVEIVAEMRGRGHDVTLLIVGPTDDVETLCLEKLADDLGASSAIRVLGVRDDVMSLLAAAGTTLLTSFQEGLPGAVLEALAVGTPVVATDLPGCRWIGTQLPGLSLVELGSPDQQWAEAVERAARRGADGQYRRDLRRAFEEGPFVLDKAAAELGTIWAGFPLGT